MKIKRVCTFMIVALIMTLIANSKIEPANAQGGVVRDPYMASLTKSSGLDISIPTTPQQLAEALGVPTTDIVSASLNGSDSLGAGLGINPIGHFFPTEGESFVILSTGLAESADDINNSDGLSYLLGGLNNSQGNDLTQLDLKLKVPANMNCASFDFAYYSEEFPEWVGSNFNDAFTAEFGGTNLTIENNQVVTPLNFAFDSNGNAVSVNSVFGMTPDTATTYDGGTSVLRAHRTVTPGTTVEFVFSVQDLGDSSWDSAVFLDKFFWSNDSQCGGSAQEDSDGDGLLDIWETQGLTVTVDGTDIFVDLPAMGADPNKKDIFVEIDYMVDNGTCVANQGCTGGHTHEPKSPAIAKIVESFKNAPVNNPDGSTGINLHVDSGPASEMNPVTHSTWGTLSLSNSLTHDDELGFRPLGVLWYDWGEFDKIKDANFSKARAAVFHYCVFAHNLGGFGSTSGISRDNIASDFIVSLGDGWSGSVGTENEQAGTFMHELGHNLGLRHGGIDNDQYKPNYLSIMNYSFQTTGLRYGLQDGKFDYSRFELPELDENNLDENVGLNGGSSVDNYGSRSYCDGIEMIIDKVNDPINWNCEGNSDETGVKENINNDTDPIFELPRYTKLKGFNDWANIVFTGGAIGQPGATPILPTQTELEELTEEENSTIMTLYKVSLYTSGNSINKPGESIFQTITVINDGINADTYNITANSSLGWANLSAIPTTISLQAGESSVIPVIITVPITASAFDQDLLTLSAVSQTNPLIEDTVSIQTNVIGPRVINITRVNITPTNETFVDFIVTFLVPVTGLDISDFSFYTIGSITNYSITNISPSIGFSDTYTITVNTGLFDGTIQLDLLNDGSIQDVAGNVLENGFFAGESYTINKKYKEIQTSQNTNDGWILESSELSNKGGMINTDATIINLGDDQDNQQFRAILSFNTEGLPDNAVITKATLKVKKQTIVGTNPFTILGGLKVDIRKSFFGKTSSLVASDFQAPASKSAVGTFGKIPVNNWYIANIGNAGIPYINKKGITQFRLYFIKDDNNNGIADYIKFFSGNYKFSASRPKLIIEYYVP